MDFLEILSYLWCNHKSFQKRVRQYGHEDLFSDLGLSMAAADKGKPHYISPGYGSKTLNGKAKPQKVVDALAQKKLREQVQLGFDLPALFDCKSPSEIDQLVEDKIERDNAGSDPMLFATGTNILFQSRHKQNYELVSLGRDAPPDRVISGGERGAWRRLAKLTLRSNVGVVHWDTEPWSGASFIAYLLRDHEEINKSYNKICMIRPSDLDLPYDEQLRRLGEDMGVDVDRARTPKALVEALRQERILLIVSDVCFISHRQESYEKERLIYQVLKYAIDSHRKETNASIITIGRSQAVLALIAPHDRSYKLSNALKSQTGFDFYRELFEYYKGHRGNTRAEEGGSRLKRGKWHYEAVKRVDDRSIWPGMIRLRAYFAANLDNYAYFDPTMGFDALCGKDDPLPKSIELFYDDLVAYIIRASSGRQSPELRSLRFCSTAKHWLTEQSLERLRQSFLPKGAMGIKVSELTKDAFKNKVDDRLCPITNPELDAGMARKPTTESNIFTLSLGIRAIVQDEWMRVDPFDRAVAHWRVAENFWKKQDSKELMAQEFPYVPHWGRSRIFLLGECIRHLVCSIDGVESASDLTVRGTDADFPSQPHPFLEGCDPSEVINFCYSRIFQREINGNKGFGYATETRPQGRSLAKRHGAFEYAAELLQLMGDERTLGKPHPNLNPNLRVSYLRECAYALLDLGELEKARELFETLNSEHAKPSKDFATDKLSLALVLTELGDFEEAEKKIKAAEDYLSELPSDTPNETIKSLEKRISTRKIHIASLNGEFPHVIQLSSEVMEAESDPKRWDTEVVHNRIRALANTDKSSSQAMLETMAAVFRASTEGYQHEALGYRVLLARLFRQRGELSIAEQILDDIQKDILLYGCSERIYLDMLYEAGRTLCAMDKHIRAYASYLRPLLIRSRGRHFSRFIDLATKHSKAVLVKVRKAQSEVTSSEWDSIIQLVKDEEELHVTMEKPEREDVLEVDPLFGYYISGSQKVIERFRSTEGIEKEAKLIG